MGVLDQFRQDGKRAMVTGASRGLGRAMALALADVGADIILTGRTQDSLDATAAEIRALGRQAFTIQADMGVPAACEQAFQAALDDFGPVDILINNVGGRIDAVPIAEQSLDSWLAMMDVNLTSCFLGTKMLGAAMIARGHGGRIINIASMNALVSNRGIGGRHYETAKAAMLQFTRAAAADWAPHRVTVNAILPGLFMTDANVEWNKTRPEVIEAIVKNVPMGRSGEPEELGPLAVYLASPAAGFVTGGAFVIDGGYTLW